MRMLLPALFCGVICAASGTLAIEHASVHSEEDGVDVPIGYHFHPGDIVYFNFRISGYQRKDEGDDTRVRLSWRIAVNDPNGVPLVASSDGKADTLVTSEDKHWMPVGRSSLEVPPFAPSGQYKILLNVQDELGGNDVTTEVRFLVAGHDVAPSGTLTIRNFRFLRSEDDSEPLEVAAYRPGETLWARFDMTGYKLDAGNRFSIEYGVKVLKQDGSTAYEQPEAANAEDSAFYPQRWVPGVFSLNIPRDLKKGQYTLVVKVLDKCGGQAFEASQKFSVE